jgi:hypothetical protein
MVVVEALPAALQKLHKPIQEGVVEEEVAGWVAWVGVAGLQAMQDALVT